MTGFEQDHAERAVAMHAAGRPVKDIAIELQASRRKVLDWLVQAGVPIELRDNINR